jgi:hypothetical protein
MRARAIDFFGLREVGITMRGPEQLATGILSLGGRG